MGRIFSICISLFFLGCGLNSLDLAGGSTSTPNERVMGQVVYPDGEFAGGLPVVVHRSDYLADTASLSLAKRLTIDTLVYTDGQGRFSVTNLDTGLYAVEIFDHYGFAAFLRVRAKDSAEISTVPVDTLTPVGSIHGTISLDSGNTGTIFVQIFGLDRGVRLSASQRSFTIADVPRGTYSVRVSVGSPLYGPDTVDAVAVSSGTETDLGTITLLPAYAWKFSKKVFFNTTQAGAEQKNDVHNFPVLLRLKNGNFPFNQARKNGEDLYFTKSDSTPLPFEIERWDSTNGRAEIWITVDTVYGNSNTQYISMYWGLPEGPVTSYSNGGRTFDTANGFQGVWHMSDAGNNVIRDATFNRYDGVIYGAASPSFSAAFSVGQALKFDGTSTYVHMPSTANSKLQLDENSDFTISAWVRAAAFDGQDHMIMGKGYENYYLKLDNTDQTGVWSFSNYFTGTGWRSVTWPADIIQPRYVVGVKRGSILTVVDDGIHEGKINTVQASILPRYTQNDFSIGKFIQYIGSVSGGPEYFEGIIDEVTVSTTARSAAWIQLSYQNQKGSDNLIQGF